MDNNKQLLNALKVLYNEYSKDPKAKRLIFLCGYTREIKDYLRYDYFILRAWIDDTLEKALKKYNPNHLNKFGIPFPVEFLEEYSDSKSIKTNNWFYKTRLKLLETEINRLEQKDIK